MNSSFALFFAIVVVGIIPILLANFLARVLRMSDYVVSFWIIIFAACFGITVVSTSIHNMKLGIDLRGGSILVYEVGQSSSSLQDQPQSEVNPDTGQTQAAKSGLTAKMDKLSSTLKRRLDPGGVKEITVRQRGASAVEIIIPEVDPSEIARLKKVVSRAGTLEFRILADRTYPEDRMAIERSAKSEDRIVKDSSGKVLGMWIPVTAGRERSFGGANQVVRQRVVRDKNVTEVLCVKDIYDVTGAFLTNASVGIDNRGGHCVNFTFNQEGGNRFHMLTSKNVPNTAQDRYRLLGIVLDESLYSAPRINSPIGDRGEITGDFTQEEAAELAAVLNAGSLPATLSKEPISEMTSGPTLGADTVRRGLSACAFSLVAVLIFMAFYYRFAGLVADFALIMNLLLLLALMISFSAAFTLPGIAGLVLSLGMAVDANVLIYERMREERGKGATIRMAIRNGFQKAYSAIIDSNITTLLVGVILYWIGTEQIKGFAVTLILGISLSMFTALFCARIIFEVADKNRWLTSLHMLRIVGKTNIDFMNLMPRVVTIAGILIVISVVAIIQRGNGLLDIDFTGGSSVQVLFKNPVKIETVRSELKELENLAVSDVQVQNEPKGMRFMVNSSIPQPKKGEKQMDGESYIKSVTELIKNKFGDQLATNDISVENVMPYSDKDQFTNARREKAAAEEKTVDNSADKKTPADTAPADTSALNSVLDMFIGTAQAEDAAPAVAEAPAAEQAPATEQAPAVEQVPAAEPAPAAEQAPATEPAPAAEPAPATEQAPATEPAPAAEPAPATEPAPAAEQAPAVPEVPATAETPAVPEVPATTEAPAVPEVPAVPGNAEVTSRFTNGTFAVLNFKEGVSYDVANSMVEEAIASLNLPENQRDFEVSNPYYEPGSNSAAAYKSWDIALTLATAEAQKVLDKVQATAKAEPVFPARNMIGSQVAGDLRSQGLAAIFASLIVMVLYLWFRFQKIYYGLAATAALINNVILSVGALAISAYLASSLGFLLIDPFKIGLTVLAGIMTIIGYSLNDTIVVFDRLREVKGKTPRLTPAMVNQAINDMLARTILTSVTTLLVVVVLYIWGGQAIHAFAFTMLVGVVVGTFSSIFIAAPLLCRLDKGETYVDETPKAE